MVLDSNRITSPSRPLQLVRIIHQAIHVSLDPDALVQSTLEPLLKLIGARGGSVWLLDDDGRNLRRAFGAGSDSTGPAGPRERPGERMASWVVEHRQPVLVHDVSADPRWSPPGGATAGANTGGLIAMPMIAGGRALGALVVRDKDDGRAFDEDDQELLSIMSDHVALAVHAASLFQRERRARERQAMLRTVGQHFHTTLDLEVLIGKVFTELGQALQCEALSLWLVDPRQDALVCQQARGGASDSIVGMRVPMGRGLVGYVGESLEPILIEDAQKDPRLYRSIDASTGYVTRSLICAPMVRQGKGIGVIQALNKQSGTGHFAPEDLDLLVHLAGSAGLAIENARLYADLASSYDSTLEALAAALDLRDRETEGHSRRVVAYTARLARAFGLSEDDVQEIARGALLHDVGKIGVPDAILHKPGLLDAAEREIMQRHPQLGHDMLSGIEHLKSEVEIVLSHQEWYDGGGYPRGLAGDAIPIGARLFAVADAYDAITSDRPYRRSKSHAEAVEEIRRAASTQFDPKAVAAFLSVPEAEWKEIRRLVEEEVRARYSTKGNHFAAENR